MQSGKVVAYTSRQWKVNKNYPTHDLELGVVIFTLEVQRYYLHKAKFEVFTYYMNLKYIFTQQDLNLGQRLQLKFIKDFHFSKANHLGKVQSFQKEDGELLMGLHIIQEEVYINEL